MQIWEVAANCYGDGQPSGWILAKAAITFNTLLDSKHYRCVPLIQP